MANFTSEDIELAKKVQATYGVPASVTLAQYALESGYGTSDLAKNNNNFFGMRNGSKGWQSFSSKEESFLAYGKLLSSDIYTSKSNGSKNVTEYVNSIAETYAPSSDGNNGYASKILNIISSNNLTQYDIAADGWNTAGSGLTTSSGTAGNPLQLSWWGDVVIVIFSIILLVGGVVFLGLAVAGDKITDNVDLVKSVKKAVK